MQNLLSKRLVVFVLSFLSLSGCASKYVGKATADFQEFSCEIATERCGITWQNGSSILYEVESIGENRYRVTGTVDYKVEHGAIRNFVVFYMLFMDDKNVIHEKRIETFSTYRELDFEFTSDSPVLQSTIDNLRLFVRT